MSPVSGNKDSNFNGMEGKHYPASLVSHQDVVKYPTAFWDSLRRFHFLMGTKFMIPVIGGKELDLHVLYVEVTRRGGFEKVIADKKWREVGDVFMFSPTTTSASFVLRKHYYSLLYHYEQAHFFKAQGLIHTPPAAVSTTDRQWIPELAIVEYSPQPINEFRDSLNEVVGTIDGKFDCGYLVSVKLGSEVLQGVLYHPELHQPAPSKQLLSFETAIVPYKSEAIRGRGRFHHRKRRKRGDPNNPKSNRSGYNFFFAEKHYMLKALYPNREREFTKMIGQSWNSLTLEERMVYQNTGLRDKERYNREVREYEDKMKLNHTSE